MKRFILFLFLAASSLSLQSQKTFGGSGYFEVGIQTLDVDPLNNFINTFGYDDLQGANITIGGGGHFVVKDFILGGRGGFIGQDGVQNQDFRLDYGGGFGQFYFGYKVIRSGGWFVFPEVGVGFIGSGIDIRPRYADANLEEVMSNPDAFNDAGVSLGSFGGLYSVQVNAQYFFKQKENASYGGMLGLSIGYRLATNGDWENAGGTSFNATPDFQPGGFFASLTIGGGYLN